MLLLEEIGLRDSAVIEAKAIDPKTLPETLALGGAVYKRKWEYGGQLEHLHEALHFYRAAWEQDNEQDMGYGGVNAAYVADILASRAKIVAARSGSEPREANELHRQAQALRGEMLDVLLNAAKRDPCLENQYWFLVTLAEVYFGLEQYDDARPWLVRAHDADPSEWERQTTFRQLISLARLQGCESPEEGSEVSSWHPAWQTLHAFLKEDTARALSCYRGKLGLALSGGGFRASLFHIGVLARLAEMDVLRHVEALSTVSGGSIVGAHYYLCSDASGQMGDQKRPSNGVLGVPLRANSILMDRVREAEYQDLRARVDSRSLNGLFFIHLKKDLEPLPLDWTHCQDPTIPPQQTTCTTSYGVDKDLQRKLAAIRTDLDSFSEVEAYSLMLSGYLMTESEFKELDRQHRKDKEISRWGDFDIDAPRSEDWPFLQLESLLRQAPDSSDARRGELGKQLAAGSALFFKIWKLSPTLRGLIITGSVATFALLIWLATTFWQKEFLIPAVSVGGLVVFLILTLLALLVPLTKWLRPQEAMRGYLGKLAFALTGYLFTNLHLRVFDPLFIKRGKLKRLLRLK